GMRKTTSFTNSCATTTSMPSPGIAISGWRYLSCAQAAMLRKPSMTIHPRQPYIRTGSDFMITVSDSMSPDDRDSRADQIIAETCKKMAMSALVPLSFANSCILSWHTTWMLKRIAECYDVSFDFAMLQDLISHKPHMLACFFGHV